MKILKILRNQCENHENQEILEIHRKITRIMKIIKIDARITNIIKIIEIHMRIMKIIKA